MNGHLCIPRPTLSQSREKPWFLYQIRRYLKQQLIELSEVYISLTGWVNSERFKTFEESKQVGILIQIEENRDLTIEVIEALETKLNECDVYTQGLLASPLTFKLSDKWLIDSRESRNIMGFIRKYSGDKSDANISIYETNTIHGNVMVPVLVGVANSQIDVGTELILDCPLNPGQDVLNSSHESRYSPL